MINIILILIEIILNKVKILKNIIFFLLIIFKSINCIKTGQIIRFNIFFILKKK
jgi:hypothetical protein